MEDNGYQQLVKRFKAFYETFIKIYEAGTGEDTDPTSRGTERQLVIEHFLKAVLPPCLRISRGWIIDSFGTKTNELDVILEAPLYFSLPPVLAGEPRLHLAEAVVAVIEIKSSFKGWDDIKKKTIDVQKLQRWPHLRRYQKSKVAKLQQLQRIPVFFIFYNWHAQIQEIEEELNERFRNKKTPLDGIPNGILVLRGNQEKGACYLGIHSRRVGVTIRAQTGGAALEAFVSQLSRLFREMLLALPYTEKVNLWF